MVAKVDSKTQAEIDALFDEPLNPNRKTRKKKSSRRLSNPVRKKRKVSKK